MNYQIKQIDDKWCIVDGDTVLHTYKRLKMAQKKLNLLLNNQDNTVSLAESNKSFQAITSLDSNQVQFLDVTDTLHIAGPAIYWNGSNYVVVGTVANSTQQALEHFQTEIKQLRDQLRVWLKIDV